MINEFFCAKIISAIKEYEVWEVAMPAYDYFCNDCKHDFVVFLSLSEYESKPKIKCPHCESDNVTKKYTSFYAKTSKKS